MPTTQILLATYNGEAFLTQQLNSLFAQSMQDFGVLVADDGSTDDTMRILDSIAEREPGRIRVIARSRVGGAARNFMRLINAADADYVLCCDQDDAWLPNKVAVLVSRCMQAEAQCGPRQPVLVHSDLTVVDSSLRTINTSLFKHQHMDPRDCEFRDLLLQSNVTGCAMLMNRALVDLIRGSNPDTMVMHDWWASLTAAAFGTIEFVDAPTVLYRQHGGNVLGATGWNAMRAMHRTLAVLGGESTSSGLRACALQAQAFIDRYASRMRPAQSSLAAATAKLRTQPRLTRGYSLLRHRLLRGGILRNSARLLFGDV